MSNHGISLKHPKLSCRGGIRADRIDSLLM